MTKHRIWAVVLLIISFLGAYFIHTTELNPNSRFGFKLGLDLSGGTHLVYKADTSKLKSADISSSMNALRDVIERRVNAFGVSEPLVQTEQGGVTGGSVNDQKLIVELPGITDVKAATEMIGRTPVLEFALIDEKIVAQIQATSTSTSTRAGLNPFIATGLTGALLKNAALNFNTSGIGEPEVSLVFNEEGRALFAKITKENVGKPLAIILDGVMISNPLIREEITQGTAQISGNFNVAEAKALVRDLNYGALPVPVTLIGTQTIGPSLGAEAMHASKKAGAWAFLIIAVFLVFWYRLPGVVAVVALGSYVVINLVLFKILPGPAQITLTAAGIAAFILSIGMAVDANILIFERMKEELRSGKKLDEAIKDGFDRAWLSIRDSNLSSIITAAILFFFASTAVVKGFALVFAIGVLTSMFTAITISRTLLLAVRPKGNGKLARFLFGNGLNN